MVGAYPERTREENWAKPAPRSSRGRHRTVSKSNLNGISQVTKEPRQKAGLFRYKKGYQV